LRQSNRVAWRLSHYGITALMNTAYFRPRTNADFGSINQKLYCFGNDLSRAQPRTSREPFHGISLEERPGGHHDKKRQCGANQSNVYCQHDILLHVADIESDELQSRH
jgi:hypothetical protein